jgi:hypothetical protein
MLSIQTHIVTMKLLGVSDTVAINNYLKTHTYDSNAWDAYFQLSPLDPSESISNAFKVLPNDLIVECAFRFAESVLPIFEKQYPTDNRPRACIEAGREYVRNPNPKTKDAAANAAYAAYAANAANAANAAYAATYAANAAIATLAANAAIATLAANAAAYANAAYAATNAANAANAAYRRETQFKIIVDVVGRSAINRIGTQNASIQL